MRCPCQRTQSALFDRVGWSPSRVAFCHPLSPPTALREEGVLVWKPALQRVTGTAASGSAGTGI